MSPVSNYLHACIRLLLAMASLSRPLVVPWRLCYVRTWTLLRLEAQAHRHRRAVVVQALRRRRRGWWRRRSNMTPPPCRHVHIYGDVTGNHVHAKHLTGTPTPDPPPPPPPPHTHPRCFSVHTSNVAGCGCTCTVGGHQDLQD